MLWASRPQLISGTIRSGSWAIRLDRQSGLDDNTVGIPHDASVVRALDLAARLVFTKPKNSS